MRFYHCLVFSFFAFNCVTLIPCIRGEDIGINNHKFVVQPSPHTLVGDTGITGLKIFGLTLTPHARGGYGGINGEPLGLEPSPHTLVGDTLILYEFPKRWVCGSLARLSGSLPTR